MLVAHGAIAVFRLIVPRRCSAFVQTTLTGVALARAQSRWVTLVGSAQEGAAASQFVE
jgi:hypothetical protein